MDPEVNAVAATTRRLVPKDNARGVLSNTDGMSWETFPRFSLRTRVHLVPQNDIFPSWIFATLREACVEREKYDWENCIKIAKRHAAFVIESDYREIEISLSKWRCIAKLLNYLLLIHVIL